MTHVRDRNDVRARGFRAFDRLRGIGGLSALADRDENVVFLNQPRLIAEFARPFADNGHTEAFFRDETKGEGGVERSAAGDREDALRRREFSRAGGEIHAFQGGVRIRQGSGDIRDLLFHITCKRAPFAHGGAAVGGRERLVDRVQVKIVKQHALSDKTDEFPVRRGTDRAAHARKGGDIAAHVHAVRARARDERAFAFGADDGIGKIFA